MANKKIALIGAGQIGGTLALLASQKRLGDVVVFDIFASVAKGKALDLSQMSSLSKNDTNITGTGSYQDIKDADVCIITAGFPRKPGMTRDQLLKNNINVIKQVAEGIKTYANNSFVIVITNPLDVMVYAFHKFSGMPQNKIVGMAGVLDSARFSTFLSWELGISREDISSFVLGGHGDDMVPLTRFSNAGGIPLPTLIEMGLLSESRLNEMIQRTRQGGAEVVNLLKTGSAFYSPALSAIKMAESYLFNQKRLLPCATKLNGEYGVKNLFLGVPTVIGSSGVEKVIELKLTEEEQGKLNASIAAVQKVVDEIETLKI
jgi:malate dehydrogenase